MSGMATRLAQTRGPSRPSTASKPQVSTVPRLTTILGACLESCIHELLFVRSIYPRESYAPSRYLGIACHASRHPDVVDYIFDTLNVAVPALVSGVADELSLVIVDARGESGTNVDRVLERYAFSFEVEKMTESVSRLESDDDVRVGQLIRDLERGLKDLLLRIISMDGVDMGTRRGRISGTTSFKLCLHTTPLDGSSQNETRDGSSGDMEDFGNPAPASKKGRDGLSSSCEELEDAVRNGSWFSPDPQSSSFAAYDGKTSDKQDQSRGTGLIRPLKSVNVLSCGLRMELLMEVKGR